MTGSRNWTLYVGIVVLTLGAAVLCRAEAPLNQLTSAERRGGWQLLFDGKTTEGWRSYRKKGVNPGWAVKNGALSRIADRAEDLISTKQFSRFELSLEYRIVRNGNSGVMFHVTEDGKESYFSGPEVQLLDNQMESASHKNNSGALYDLYEPDKPQWAQEFAKAANFEIPDLIDATRPAGEWNHLYLRVADQGEVAINGVHYFYFEKGSDEWNKRVAQSKFADMPGFGQATAGHICFQDHGGDVAFRNIKIRELAADGSVPPPVDGELPYEGTTAYPLLTWEGWSPVDEAGRVQLIRPLVLTHAGDGSNRVFVAMQGGRIYVLDGSPEATTASIFLDLSDRVADWSENSVGNEEGLLGLAFHPKFKKNRQFFVYYTSRAEPHTSVVSRFQVSKDRPDQVESGSEEVLLKMKQPFANHNGGSIAFGPDGLLYIGLGDGGYRDDPLNAAQDLTSFMGSILRIDVDRKQDGMNYAVPADNPFTNHANALPEIYAFGFRNLWRIAFDRLTGRLWAADIGQDLWEEINLVESGGNYGWSAREGTHLFGNRHALQDDKLIDPIWEYDHRIGKSITGGNVYRGAALPGLRGYYLYGDYVSGDVWALKYDEKTKAVVENMAISSDGSPVYSFGEDEQGEVYYMTESSTGRGIYRITAVAAQP